MVGIDKTTAIREVHARPLIIPYPDVRKFGRNALSQGEHVFVRVVTEEGIEGIGEAISRPFIYGESIASILHAIKEWLAPAMMGRSAFDAASFWADWSGLAGNHSAKAALDMALLDIQAKAVGLPLWKWLGGVDRAVPLSWILTYGSVEETVAEAVHRVDQGYRWFKIKISDDAATDRRVLEALKTALPAHCQFYGDANGTISAGTALARIDEFSRLGLKFIEDPVAVSDFATKRKLHAACPIPVMADESAKSVQECAHEIMNDCVDIFSLKIFRTGFTQSREIETLARAFNKSCVVGGQGETHLGAALSCHFASAIRARGSAPFPAETATSYRYDFNVLSRGPAFEAGKMILPATAGSGVELDYDVLNRFAQGTDCPGQRWIRLTGAATE
jgi:L-alanine-DL-glutamate epimerase-like enolase superfamily enzyme